MKETSSNAQPEQRRARKFHAKEARVIGKSRVSPDLIRLKFSAPDIKNMDLPFTDHYVKLLFVPENADYSWPFDVMEMREKQPPQFRPFTRTYTLRSFDRDAGVFDIDFVAHGSTGVAGPWAERAQIGEKIGYGGPGGAWFPKEEYEHFVFAGDESAAPAIMAGLEKLPENASACAFIEVRNEGAVFDVPTSDRIEVMWVYRKGSTCGMKLVEALRGGIYPQQRTAWFIHGVAEMIKDVRRFLFVEKKVSKEDVSISGYWRLGMTEDQWQSSKKQFNAEILAAERSASQS